MQPADLAVGKNETSQQLIPKSRFTQGLTLKVLSIDVDRSRWLLADTGHH